MNFPEDDERERRQAYVRRRNVVLTIVLLMVTAALILSHSVASEMLNHEESFLNILWYVSPYFAPLLSSVPIASIYLGDGRQKYVFRRYVVLTLAPLAFAVAFYFSRGEGFSHGLYVGAPLFVKLWYYAPYVLPLLSLASVCLAYLQTGFVFREHDFNFKPYIVESSQGTIANFSTVIDRSTVDQDVTPPDASKDGTTEPETRTPGATLSSVNPDAGLSDYDRLVAAFLEQARKDPNEVVYADLLARAKRANGAAASDVMAARGFTESRERLLREIESLGRRGNINLLLGMAISVAGLAVLGSFFFSANGSVPDARLAGGLTSAASIAATTLPASSPSAIPRLAIDLASAASAAAAALPASSSAAARQAAEHLFETESAEVFSFGIHFLPRLSFALLIELFAYFFLKLYKSSLSEIKYFQNEITNIEAKSVALRVALSSDSAAVTGKVLGSLMDTERNHILEKGQTTVDLERAKIEKAGISEFTKGVSSLLEKIKGKN